MQDPFNVVNDLFRRQVVPLVHDVQRYVIGKFTLGTKVEHLHVGWSVVARNRFAKTAGNHPVLQGDHQIVIFLQVVEVLLVDVGDRLRVDQGGIDVELALELGKDLFT